jgi:hypothetical protein
VIPDAGVWAFGSGGQTSRIIELSYAVFLFSSTVSTGAGSPFEQVRQATEFGARARKSGTTPGPSDLMKRIGEGSTFAGGRRGCCRT